MKKETKKIMLDLLKQGAGIDEIVNRIPEDEMLDFIVEYPRLLAKSKADFLRKYTRKMPAKGVALLVAGNDEWQYIIVFKDRKLHICNKHFSFFSIDHNAFFVCKAGDWDNAKLMCKGISNAYDEILSILPTWDDEPDWSKPVKGENLYPVPRLEYRLIQTSMISLIKDGLKDGGKAEVYTKPALALVK